MHYYNVKFEWALYTRLDFNIFHPCSRYFFYLFDFCASMKWELKWSISPPSFQPGVSNSSSASTVEESLCVQEEFALAAMKALYHIVCESSEAVNSVLGGQDGKDSEKLSENRLRQPQSSTAENTCDELQSHSPLLKKLFQLVDLKFVSNASQREAVVNSSLRTLCALAERAEESQLWRYMSFRDSFFTSLLKWHHTPVKMYTIFLLMFVFVNYTV